MANTNDLVLDNVTRGEVVVEEDVAKVGGLVSAIVGHDANVPTYLLMLEEHQEE